MKDKIKYYSLDEILKYNADYNMIYGERSSGKTTSVLRYALEDYIKSGFKNQLAIIRRWDTDFKGGNGQQMFDGIIKLNWVYELTEGHYNSIYYYSQRWYLCYYDDKGEKLDQEAEPFAFGFSITSEEHYKSTSYPDVKTILFDEFITRTYYLPGEFVKFQNLLSTIIRKRTDVKIFMCGNSINKYCIYFNEMGLTNIKTQKQGTIDIYTYGESELKVAVEYTGNYNKKDKSSNKYFAFNNPKLKMITDGGWEIDIYPHLPMRYTKKNIVYFFFIIFDRDILRCNIINIDNEVFLFIHRKTTEIREDNKQLVYQQHADYRRHYRTNILKPFSKPEKKIYELICKEKVFYQDNEVGEIFANYLKWCRIH